MIIPCKSLSPQVLVDDVWLKDGLIVCEGFLPGSNPKGTLPMLTLTNSGYNKVRPSCSCPWRRARALF